MSRRLFGLFIIGVASAASLISDPDLRVQLFEPYSFSFVYGSLIPIVFIAARSGAAHWSESTLALGVPLGLLGGTLGVTGMAADMTDYHLIYFATAIMLLSIYYGGFASAFGFFAISRARTRKSRLTKTSLVLALLPLIFLTVFAMAGAGGFLLFFSPVAISVFLGVFGLQVFIGHSFSFQRVIEGALFASILCIILGLIRWYGAGELDRDAINLAASGLNYGLLIYVLAYVVSLSQEDKESNKIETGRANWHWMEVTAFMIFMLFAPETLRETLMNEQDAVAQIEETELLEQRFASLEQRISDIENQ